MCSPVCMSKRYPTPRGLAYLRGDLIAPSLTYFMISVVFHLKDCSSVEKPVVCKDTVPGSAASYTVSHVLVKGPNL